MVVAILTIFSFAVPATGQPLNYVTIDYGSAATFLTGIRGDTFTGNYVIPNSGGATGGLLYSNVTGAWTPFPEATADGVNFPDATTSSPYGPSFGTFGGILRVVGSYETTASSPYDLGYLYDSAAPPGENITTLQYPNSPGDTTLYTIAHSTFGDQIVGNYDTQLATGNAFIYDISTGTYRTNDKPGAVSTTAYGIWGNLIAGGYAGVSPGGGPAPENGYIYNETTGVWTSYDYPGAVATHFDGIAGGGQAGTYNLIAFWVDTQGQTHGAVLHLDAAGNATWINISVPGAVVTTANSIYQDEVTGIYINASGQTQSFIVNVPGIYSPIENNGTLTTSAAGTPAIGAAAGDDVLNNGMITTSGVHSAGVADGTYGVVTNNGQILVSGAGSAAVEMDGLDGTLLNAGLLRAAPGGYAITADPTASGSIVVNDGTIDGPVSFLAGPLARFENSGWLGISAPGTGTIHMISGTFAQTDAGTLALRVGADGSHDALQIDGSGQLAGTLTLMPQPGLYADQTSYQPLVSATDALWGSFGSIGSSSPFFRASLIPGTNSLGAELTRIPFDSFTGLTSNQSAVGSALEQDYRTALNTDPGAALFGSLLAAPGDPANVPATYDALSGAGLTGIQQTTLDTNQSFVEAIRNQGAVWLSGADVGPDGVTLDAGPPGPGSWRSWAEGMGGAGQLNGALGQSATSLSMNFWGFAAGLEYAPTADSLVGAAVGGSSSSYSDSGLATQGSIPGVELGLYALKRWNDVYVAGTLGYGRYHATSTRDISALGLTAVADSGFDANALTGRIESGYVFKTAAVTLTPFVAYEVSTLWEPGFSENIGGATVPLGLAVDGQTTTSQQTFLGLQIDQARPLNSLWTLENSLSVSWAHEFDTERGLTASFEANPAAGFFVTGAPAAANSALLSDALYFVRGSRQALFAAFNADASGQGQAFGGSIGFRFAW